MEKSLPALPGQSTTNNAPAAPIPLVSVQTVRTGFRAGLRDAKDKIKRAISPSPDKKRHSSPVPLSGQSSLSVQTSVASATASVSTLSISTTSSTSIAPTSTSTLNVSTTRSTPSAPTTNSTPSSSTVGSSNMTKPVIFPQSSERTVKVPAIATGQLFETTSQLAYYARLLTMLDQQPSSLSASSSNPPVTHAFHPTMKDREWMNNVKDDKMEQDRIRWLVVGLVNEFLRLSIKDTQSIHEIVLLGSALDKDSYQALLRCFLEEFDKGSMLDVEMLRGLVQIIEDAPSEYLEVDNLVKILTIVRVRLESTAQQSKNLVVHLTQAVSRVLSVMADQKVKDLDRVKAHSPVGAVLSGLNVKDHPYLKYQSMHARQALKEVPDDERRRECFFRHFTNVTGSLIKVSRVLQMDFDGFAKGAVEVQKNIKYIYDLLKDGWDDIKAVKEQGVSIFNDLSGARPWFTSLRAAEDYIQKGQLVELSAYINTAPGCGDENFQWGICQFFAEMAIDLSWDAVTRGCSIDQLEQIYSKTLHPNIKSWILTLLKHISEVATIDGSIKLQATALIQQLKADNIQPFDFSCTLGRRLPSPASFKLLEIVNNTPNLEPRLHIIQADIKTKRLEERRLDVYVSLMSKISLKASSTENMVPLQTRVTEFLAGNHEVLLILGDSGAGKSTFNVFLHHKLWSEYKPGDPISLLVDLKAMGSLKDVDMIKSRLVSLNFDDSEIKEVKRSRDLILICDGYDECGQSINIHTRLKSQLGWKSLKLIITCRTQYLESMADRVIFQPQEDGPMAFQESKLFEEAVIVPFDEGQVGDCIEQFIETEEAKTVVFVNQPVWTADEYSEYFKSLADMVKNPYMLQIALRSLPKMVNEGRNIAQGKLTRFELYDEFTKQHFQKEMGRLTNGQSVMDMDEKRAFDFLRVQFYHHCMGFSKRLAYMTFTKNDGVNRIEYSMAGGEESWKDDFFYYGVDSKDVQLRLLRKSSQLISYPVNGSGSSSFSESTRTMYLFPHRSLLEYFYACQICDFQDSIASHRFFKAHYNNLATGLASTTIPSLVANHPLNDKKIMSEPSIINFLVERVQKDSMFKDQLCKVILLSMSDENVSQAAANAITILVRAGHRFNNQDLQGIRIRGANLTGGQFDNTQLQGADLRDCTLRNTWLRQADLSHADMENVQFGERPYIQEDDRVMSCAFSSDGEMFVCGLYDGTIKVYDASTWVELYIIEAHSDPVLSVGFSPDGLHIASGSQDHIVRLWNAQTSALELILKGCRRQINCVAYSPNGKQIASASDDWMVRVWDAQTGEVCMILNGHSYEVYSVTYSLNGKRIASGGRDEAVRIWNAQNGSICQILEGHTDIVTSVVYSPSGEHIASGSRDRTVRLWNALTGQLERTLKGHTDSVTSIAYTSTGHQIVSGGRDKTVRLWDARSGALDAVMEGHSAGIESIAYSPNDQIASGSEDCTVRLWDTQIITTDPVFQGHTNYVSDLIFSPNGHQIASSSYDRTVRLRDATTGALSQVLNSHTHIVSSIAYSPSGLQIVSGSHDGTVRLWDATTGDSGFILNGHTDAVWRVVYSRNGQQIASISDDATVRLWDAQTGALIRILNGDVGLRGIVYSPTGQQIASWGYAAVHLWDAHTGERGHVLESHNVYIKNVLYSPSGQHIVVLNGMDVRLWDAQKGVQVLDDPLDTDAASMAFSPCGRQIVVGGHNGEIQLWDTQTGGVSLTLKGHTQWVASVAYSPNGELIASGSHDNLLRVWDVHLGVCLAVVEFAGQIGSIVWSARIDGTFIAVQSGDNAVSVCQVVEVDGQTKVLLLWTTSETRLNVSNARIQNVDGLTRVNRQLLKQRGAVVDEDGS